VDCNRYTISADTCRVQCGAGLFSRRRFAGSRRRKGGGERAGAFNYVYVTVLVTCALSWLTKVAAEQRGETVGEALFGQRFGGKDQSHAFVLADSTCRGLLTKAGE